MTQTDVNHEKNAILLGAEGVKCENGSGTTVSI